MSSFDFVISLTDKLSGPARTAMSAASSLQSSVASVSKGLEGLEPAAAAAAAGFDEMAGAEAVADALDPITLAIGALVAAAAVATGGLAALTAVIYEGAEASLDASEAHRDLLSSLTALGGGAASGQQALGIIRDLESVVPESEAQLSTWTKQLEAAGVTDMSKLHDQLLAIASSEALVEGGGEKVKSLLTKLAETSEKGSKVRFSLTMLQGTGVSETEFLQTLGMTPQNFQAAIKAGKLTGAQIADAITKTLAAKGKAPLENAMSDMGTIVTKLHDNVMKLFEDVNAKPFVDALKDLAGIFDQSTASGKTFKLLITSTFNAVFQAAAKVVPYVKAFLLQVAINALKFYIALKPVAAKLEEMLSAKPDNKSLNWARAFADALTSMLPIIVRVVQGIEWIIETVTKVANLFGSAKTAGGSFVQGLVQGITGGGGSVTSAVQGLASSALSSFKNVLGIHSPSSVMRDLGGHIGGGLELGIGDAKPGASQAMRELAEPPRVKGGNTDNSSRSSAHYEINVYVGGDGGGDAKQTAKVIRAELADLFDQLANTQGV